MTGPIDPSIDALSLAAVTGTSLPLCELLFLVASDDSDVVRKMRSDARDQTSLELRRVFVWCARATLTVCFEQIGRCLNRERTAAMREHHRATDRRVLNPWFFETTTRVAHEFTLRRLLAEIDEPTAAGPNHGDLAHG